MTKRYNMCPVILSRPRSPTREGSVFCHFDPATCSAYEKPQKADQEIGDFVNCKPFLDSSRACFSCTSAVPPPFCPSDIFPVSSGKFTGQKSYNPHLRWGFDYNPIQGIVLVPLKGVSQTTLLLYSFELLASFLSSSACSMIYFFIVSSEIVPIVAT